MSIDVNIKEASKKLFHEINKSNPSTLITLYEFDLRDYALSKDDYALSQLNFLSAGIQPPYAGLTPAIDQPYGILRFHNLTINLENVSPNLANYRLFNQIIWQGKRYIPFPIYTEGFEIKARGTLPKPKLTLSNQIQNEDYDNYFKQVKNAIKSLDDIIGVKVTRKRTFLKYLDAINFKSNGGIINDENFTIDPDPFAELPSDIYYIDRKLRENRFILEYELSSILDLENLKLPLRTMYADSCTFEYRGEGCEYSTSSNVYGTRKNNGAPIADGTDSLISTSLGGAVLSAGSPEEWNPTGNNIYAKGKWVFVNIKGIKYYFVCKGDFSGNPINATVYTPFNKNYWIADACSKKIKGCRLRFFGNLNTVQGLPFGGFPATSRYT